MSFYLLTIMFNIKSKEAKTDDKNKQIYLGHSVPPVMTVIKYPVIAELTRVIQSSTNGLF